MPSLSRKLLIYFTTHLFCLSLSAASAETVDQSAVLSSDIILKNTLLCYANEQELASFGLVEAGDGNEETPYQVVSADSLLAQLKRKVKNFRKRAKKSSGEKQKKLNKKKRKFAQGRKEIVAARTDCLSLDGGGEEESGGEQGSNNLADLSDEFTQDTLSQFILNSTGPNFENYYTTLDISDSRTGWLTLVPGGHAGWYATQQGPGLFKSVEGNFIIETYVSVTNRNDRENPPQEDYNSAGVMARNPSGETQNYIMVNLGMQSVSNGTGSESKTTQNSSSQLYLQPGSSEGRVRLCRVGDNFYSARFLTSDTAWTLTQTFERQDLPETLHVGLIANAWGQTESETEDNPPDLYAEFDYVRYSRPNSASDCTAE